MGKPVATHRVGIDAGALGTSGRCRQLPLVELVGTAHVGQHDPAVDGEDQALHDLAQLHTDRGGGIGRRLRAIGEAARLDREATLGGGFNGADDIGVQLLAHCAASVSTRAASRRSSSVIVWPVR